MDSNGSLPENFTSRPRVRSRRPDMVSGAEWDEVAFEEWMRFTALHDRCIAIFDKVETALLIIGLIGNLLAIVTLLRGHHMRTPSFVYHKALVLAYLTYCSNFLIVKLVNSALTIPSERRQLSYYNPLAAYYAVILNRVITSVCGYLALYTSLAISVDRFLALIALKSYSKFNRHYVAYWWVATSLLLSVCVHSWAPWLENEIHTIGVALEPNRTILAYRHRESVTREKLKPYLMAKDWYNLIIRFAYAILLTGLTSTVIYMFTQQQKKRSTLCHVSKRQLRRERCLFYLMIAVVIMAYIQVIPRESKRILELIYPPEYVAAKVDDQSLAISVRKAYLLFGLYAFTFTTPILNLCTTIERSLLFYLYFTLNHTFRREVLTLLHLRHAWSKVASKFGISVASDRRSTFETTTRDGPSAMISTRSSANTSGYGRKLGGSDASFGGSQEVYGQFLTASGQGRRSSSRCGSSQTTYSEYSSIV